MVSYSRTLPTDEFHDKNVDAVVRKFEKRAALGMLHYGADTTRNDFSLRDWLREAQDEALDIAVYLEACLNKLPE